jgi:hypothetical protein
MLIGRFAFLQELFASLSADTGMSPPFVAANHFDSGLTLRKRQQTRRKPRGRQQGTRKASAEASPEWTPDGHLRHSSLAGLRDDKEPNSVRREYQANVQSCSSRKV